MPLLKKKVFQKRSVPDFLKDDEEVFYCEITNEIFRDYEEFSERMFLCNSMVWACSMTGKQNLTYQEALESEEHAKQILKEFPNELKKPILYIASKTQKTSFGEMAEDLFLYIKDRYFIGENLESCFTGDIWKHCHVLSVIAPSEEEIQDDQQKNKTGNEKHFGTPAHLYKYEIEHLDSEDRDISEIMIVDNTQLRRRKALFSRDKCKLFIKQYVEQDERGMFVIKPSVMDDFGITTMKWEQVYAGPEPKFETSKKLDSPNNKKKKQRQETLAKFLQKNGVLPQSNNNKEKKGNNLLEQMKKREEEFKKNKQLKEEERLAEKQRKKEENVRVAQYLKQWSKAKEDLELENQAVLPVPTPVKCRIPEGYFGDAIMVLEFVDTFSKLLSTKNFFPGGFTFEIMERALVENEVAGPLTDIIQMLLTAIFNVQDEESNQYRTSVENAKEINEEDLPDNLSLTDAAHLATLASKWSNKYQGMPLGRLPLYSLTVSEVLRLHLLSSGARINETGARWRYAQRGGYSGEDDPGLHLRLRRPHLVRALAVRNVVELTVGDKLRVIRCLIDQLLTYADVRDVIEERLERTKRLKLELRATQAAERRREGGFATSRARVRRENKEDPLLAEKIERMNEENEKKQVQNAKKIEKLIKAINEAQNVMGYDRAYRRYLRIDSVPAIMVNFEDEHAGTCLGSPIKQYPEAVNADKKQLVSHVKALHENHVVDKENGKRSPKKVNGSRSPVKKESFDYDDLLMCSSDPATCIVHSDKVPRDKWSFFHKEEQIDELLKTLNPRGIREGELLDVLKNDKENILNIIRQTPATQLNPDAEIKKEEEDQMVLRNSKKNKDRYEDANLGYPLGMSPAEVMHCALIDNILEMEEKVSAGGLGAIRVKNRDEWRNCLQNRQYSKLDKTIVKNEGGKHSKPKKGERRNGSRPATPDVAPRDYLDPGRFLVDGEEATGDDDTGSEQPEEVGEAVRCLAVALAQVAAGIDARCLKKPLGHCDVTKAELSSKKTEYDVLDKWEQSLLSSTSFSQVFLHYGTLDSCVMWSRSALLARCRICRRQKDSENMLLCTSCTLGHHLYCLKPKLTVMPKGEWFCDRCQKEKEQQAKLLSPEPTPQKKRKIFKEEEVDEEEDVEEEERSGEEEDLEEEESSEEEVEEEEEQEVKEEICKMCGSDGELIVCEKCSESYHLECCEPPLRRAPRGQWTCHSCKREDSHAITNGKDSDSGDEVIQNRRSHRRENGRDDLPLHNAALQELLSNVMKQDDAWAFLKPVQKTEVPDYYDVITKPMDFGRIKYKLNMGDYNEDSQVMVDVAQVFENCSIYNEVDSEVYNCGVRLMKYFVKKAKELGLRVPNEMDDEDDVQPKSKRRRNK